MGIKGMTSTLRVPLNGKHLTFDTRGFQALWPCSLHLFASLGELGIPSEALNALIRKAIP